MTKHTPEQAKSGFGEIDTKLADWIDNRLRETTNLGEGSALVANDLVANLPQPFAAAPELLAACKELCNWIVLNIDGVPQCASRAGNIIRKARGE